MSKELEDILAEGIALRKEIEEEISKEEFIRLPCMRDKIPDRSVETTKKMLKLQELRNRFSVLQRMNRPPTQLTLFGDSK